MSIERKLLSDLVASVNGLSEGGLKLEIGDYPAGRYLVLRHANGEELMSANVDDIFDADGNRFEDDLP